MVSHEFRTPLSTVLMLLEGLILQNNIQDGVRPVLILIISQINLLMSFVNDMLDIKLIAEGKFAQKLSLFKPRETLAFINSMFEPQFRMLNLPLRIEIKNQPNEKGAKGKDTRLLEMNSSSANGNQLPDILYGDQIRLKQILINLINNALKFTQTGEVKIQINYAADDQLLVVSVIDTGAGIDQ